MLIFIKTIGTLLKKCPAASCMMPFFLYIFKKRQNNYIIKNYRIEK